MTAYVQFDRAFDQRDDAKKSTARLLRQQEYYPPLVKFLQVLVQRYATYNN